MCREDGSVRGDDREGLWDFDTRILSAHRIRLDGQPPRHIAKATPEEERWVSHLLVPRTGGDAMGPLLPQDALTLSIERCVGHGMVERLEIRNRSMAPVETELVLELDADFLDIQEIGVERRQVGGVERTWDGEGRILSFDYRAERGERRLHRALRVRIVQAASDPVAIEEAPADGGGNPAGARGHASVGIASGAVAPHVRASGAVTPHGRSTEAPASEGRAPEAGAVLEAPSTAVALRFEIALGPGGAWRALLRYESLVDGRWRTPASKVRGPMERSRLRAAWRRSRTRLTGGPGIVPSLFERAAEDLFALRAWEFDAGRHAWMTNAGVPTYTGIFGRDSLTAAWQGALIGPEMLRGALEVIAGTQATGDSAWRDMEPGKLIHEMRRGPLSELDIIPQRAYYGTQTTSAMFVVALSEAWHWTGDDDLLRRHRETALRTFEWARRYGDRDGDGFLEYVRRSPRGLKNHGWKDSDEAIRYPDGRLVENPIATVEEQAYHYMAQVRMAEMLLALGEDDRAEAFLLRARELRRKWHEAYWMEDEGYYALALDPDKRPVRTITSNPGHALAVGIAPREAVQRVADRMFASDLFSGWGIRTLSSDHPSYNPLAYHLGTVWPVENATFALGFKRHGLDEHAERLVGALLTAAAYFHELRLPEALGGEGPADTPIPTMYPMSNAPQAWSASATIQLVQSLLGVYPFAPARALFLVRPRLPKWLRRVTLHHVRVGNASVSIRFEREADGSASHEVIEREGKLLVLSAPPPNDVSGEGGWGEAVGSWALEHAPGRLARAARIALGVED